MLSELSIQGLGLVESARLQFTPGFCVITGETGAGKSTLLNALRLLSGGRADGKMIQNGASKAVIDGVWELPIELIEELGKREVEIEDGELYISRSIHQDGKSRLSVSGRPVPNSYMSELAETLVEIHGQSDQLKLRNTDVQRELLDVFAGENFAKALKNYSAAYAKWRQLKKQIKELQENTGKREIELQYNRNLSQRFTELDPQKGEIEELSKEIEKIAHLEDIAEGVRDALGLMLPEDIDSPTALIGQAAGVLWKLSKYDERLNQLADLLDDGLKIIEPALQELENYADSIDLDSLNRLRELEDRVVDLKSFAKPFGNDLDKAIEASLKAQEELSQQEEELDLEELQERLTELYEAMLLEGRELSVVRELASQELSSAVNVELSGLAMKGVEFVVQLTASTPSAHGLDSVEFMVETKGANRRPITKAASGGELSRIMLALELVTSAESSPATLVFDEIDSGVGGSTAIEIGKRLAKLAQTHQVILVSHLPQVAAWAETHYVLAKEETESGVETTIQLVENSDRVREIARMLSGLADSDTGLAHAQELLATAKEVKENFS